MGNPIAATTDPCAAPVACRTHRAGRRGYAAADSRAAGFRGCRSQSGSLERRFGYDRVQGAHHERDGVERPDRTPSRAELQQQERTGITGKHVKEEVTAAFRMSDGPEAFRAALHQKGYTLARGDRRDYVILDQKGGIHSLTRRVDGMKAAELRVFMAAMNPESVPNIEQAREIIEERDRREREREESHDEARIEAGYSHGDGYVSQSRAALRDHGRRQCAAEEAAGSGKVEMSEARRRRLDCLAAASEANDRARDHTEDDPGRQNEAPGGGHTRSR
jgi:hypothetical protein